MATELELMRAYWHFESEVINLKGLLSGMPHLTDEQKTWLRERLKEAKNQKNFTKKRYDDEARATQHDPRLDRIGA